MLWSFQNIVVRRASNVRMTTTKRHWAFYVNTKWCPYRGMAVYGGIFENRWMSWWWFFYFAHHSLLLLMFSKSFVIFSIDSLKQPFVRLPIIRSRHEAIKILFKIWTAFRWTNAPSSVVKGSIERTPRVAKRNRKKSKFLPIFFLKSI